MSEKNENINKRIAQNTMLLYLRLIIVMGVSLFTVRVVLKALGVVDYGIHNVVAGIVTMFSFITMTLSTGTVRFFSFQLGEKNIDKLNKLFNLSLLYFCVIIVFVFIISETMGIWFVENKLTIPSERLNAAYWVFQFSIFTFAVNLIDVPFKSLIISYERMNVYAYISIIEVMLKLLIVYILTTITFDKLIVYSALLAFSSVVITLSYILYCKCYLDGCKFRPYWNAKMFRELFSFCGWNLIGALSNVLRSQGINILLNIFFTPVVNAARAIAFQINTAVNNFVLNFYTSFRPQITKLYASDKLDEMTKLVLLSSKVSFYLILFLAIPIILEVDNILCLWLSNVPEYTALFTRLVVINAVIESLSYPLSAAVMSTGKNKWYQIVTGGLLLLNLPLAYVFLQLGYPPQVTMEISIVITAFSILSRFLFVRHCLSVSLKRYVNEVVKYIVMVSITSILFPFCFHCYLDYGLIRLVLIFMVSTLSIALSIYVVGVSKPERQALNRFLITKYYNIISRK